MMIAIVIVNVNAMMAIAIVNAMMAIVIAIIPATIAIIAIVIAIIAIANANYCQCAEWMMLMVGVGWNDDWLIDAFHNAFNIVYKRI